MAKFKIGHKIDTIGFTEKRAMVVSEGLIEAGALMALLGLLVLKGTQKWFYSGGVQEFEVKWNEAYTAYDAFVEGK